MPNWILQIVPPFFCIMMLSQQDRPLTPPTLGQYWPHVGPLVSRSVCFARAVLFFPSLIDYLKVLSIFGESPQICLFSKQDIFVYSCYFSDVWNKGRRLFKFIQLILFLLCETEYFFDKVISKVSSVVFHAISQPRMGASQTTTQAPPRGAWEGWTKLIALPVTETFNRRSLHSDSLAHSDPHTWLGKRDRRRNRYIGNSSDVLSMYRE